MMQPIVVEYGEGLSEGIRSAGNAIGGALMNRAKENKRRKTASILGETLESLPPNPTAIDIQKAMLKASQNKEVDQEYLNDMFTNLMPLYKSSLETNENMNALRTLFPNSQMFGGGQQNETQISNQENTGAVYPQKLTREALMEQQGTPPFMLPQQREMAGIPPTSIQPKETIDQSALPESEQADTPVTKYNIFHPGLGEINRSQIDALLVQKNQGLARLGQSLDKQWNDEYKANSKENAEIRKEYRQQINDYSKPYQEISKLHVNLNKLKEADKLIDTGKVSMDEQKFRTGIIAALEGHDSLLAEMFKTPEQQKLWFLMKDFLAAKDVGGSNPSTKEVLLSMSSKPGMYKGKEANKYMIKQMIKFAETELHKGEQISKLRQSGKSMPFAKFQGQVEDSANQFLQERQSQLDKDMVISAAKNSIKGRKASPGFVWMADSEGVAREIPQKEIKIAQEAGGTLLNE